MFILITFSIKNEYKAFSKFFIVMLRGVILNVIMLIVQFFTVLQSGVVLNVTRLRVVVPLTRSEIIF
jgi:hypothetical protein